MKALIVLLVAGLGGLFALRDRFVHSRNPHTPAGLKWRIDQAGLAEVKALKKYGKDSSEFKAAHQLYVNLVEEQRNQNG